MLSPVVFVVKRLWTNHSKKAMDQPLPCITEDLESLQARLRSERDPPLRPRLHLLVLLKSGQVTTRREAAAHLAVHRNTVALWLRTYRDGGLPALLLRINTLEP